jgi:hypothetical protein
VSKSEVRFVAPLTVRIAVVGEVQPYLREALSRSRSRRGVS